jgi:ribosome-binding protein aMBF1 (putative translation factor)
MNKTNQTKLAHQDLEPVILRREKTKKEMVKTKEIQAVRKQQPANGNAVTPTLSKKSANDYDPENLQAPTTSNHDLGTALQQARMTKNLTQTELDNRCSFPKNTVRDYENGTAKIVPDQLNKLNSVLSVKLPRPKK